MSTTQSPTNQDDRSVEAGGPSADREDATSRERSSMVERRGPAPSTPPAPPPSAAPDGEPSSDRAVDADLLVDIPKLTVEELNLELEAALVLRRIKLDAKGLDAEVFLKSNFGNLAALAAGRSSDDDDVGTVRGGGAGRVRSSLRELLGSAHDSYRDIEPQLGAVHEPDDDADEPDADDGAEGGEDTGGDGASGVGERAVRAARQGAKAVGLTAAGVAGGALLESTLKPSHRLPLPRRRNRAQALLHDIQRRLP